VLCSVETRRRTALAAKEGHRPNRSTFRVVDSERRAFSAHGRYTGSAAGRAAAHHRAVRTLDMIGRNEGDPGVAAAADSPGTSATSESNRTRYPYLRSRMVPDRSTAASKSGNGWGSGLETEESVRQTTASNLVRAGSVSVHAAACRHWELTVFLPTNHTQYYLAGDILREDGKDHGAYPPVAGTRNRRGEAEGAVEPLD